MNIDENQFLYATGKKSPNNLYDLNLKLMSDGGLTYMEIFSLSSHLYGWPNNHRITQSSTGISTRVLSDKYLMKLQKDLYKMAAKVKRFRKNKR